MSLHFLFGPNVMANIGSQKPAVKIYQNKGQCRKTGLVQKPDARESGFGHFLSKPRQKVSKT